MELDDRAADLMTITVETVNTTLKQAIICFQGQTVLESISCFLKVSVVVLEECD